MQTNPEQILRAQIADLQSKINFLYARLEEPQPYPTGTVTAADGTVIAVSSTVRELAQTGNIVAAINQLRAEQPVDLRTAKKIVEAL